MPVNVFSDNSGTSTASATAAYTDTYTAGDVIQVFCRVLPASGQTITGVTDNRGQTYTRRGNVVTGADGALYAHFAAVNVAAGSTTITLTASGVCTRMTLWGWDALGCGTSPFDITTDATIVAPGGSTDSISVTLTNTKAPALIMAVAVDVSASGISASDQGTGFTRQGSEFDSTGASNFIAWGEWKRITTIGTQTVTFTPAAGKGADSYVVMVDIFDETGAVGAASFAPDDTQLRKHVPRRPADSFTLPAIAAAPAALPWASDGAGAPKTQRPTRAAQSDSLGPLIVATPLKWAPNPALPVAYRRPYSNLPTDPVFGATLTSNKFPLTASGRLLIDAQGSQFRLAIDSAWSAIVNLSPVMREAYLDDLVAKGFTAVLVELTDKKFNDSKPPKNLAGDLPWTKTLNGSTYTGSPNGTTTTSGNNNQWSADPYTSSPTSNQMPDFTFTNATYFANAVAFVQACRARGLLAVLFPCFIGFNLSDHGWMLELEQNFLVTGFGGLSGQTYADNTKTKAWNYGAFIADTFKACPNILWVNAGDFGPDIGSGLAITSQQLNAVDDLMKGIKSVGAGTSLLHGAEWERWNAGSISQDETLTNAFDVSLCYTASTPAVEVFRAYATGKPMGIIELAYNGATTIGTTSTYGAPYRKYFWWPAALGAGVTYGDDSFPLWDFPSGYASNLNTQSRLDAATANAFFASIAWQKLVPSTTVITANGHTTADQTYIAASTSADGTICIAYVPPAWADGTFNVDMSVMSGGTRARWWDPVNGNYTAIGTNLANSGTRTFTPPGNNSSGTSTDWVLVMDSAGPLGAVLDPPPPPPRPWWRRLLSIDAMPPLVFKPAPNAAPPVGWRAIPVRAVTPDVFPATAAPSALPWAPDSPKTPTRGAPPRSASGHAQPPLVFTWTPDPASTGQRTWPRSFSAEAPPPIVFPWTPDSPAPTRFVTVRLSEAGFVLAVQPSWTPDVQPQPAKQVSLRAQDGSALPGIAVSGGALAWTPDVAGPSSKRPAPRLQDPQTLPTTIPLTVFPWAADGPAPKGARWTRLYQVDSLPALLALPVLAWAPDGPASRSMLWSVRAGVPDTAPPLVYPWTPDAARTAVRASSPRLANSEAWPAPIAIPLSWAPDTFTQGARQTALRTANLDVPPPPLLAPFGWDCQVLAMARRPIALRDSSVLPALLASVAPWSGEPTAYATKAKAVRAESSIALPVPIQPIPAWGYEPQFFPKPQPLNRMRIGESLPLDVFIPMGPWGFESSGVSRPVWVRFVNWASGGEVVFAVERAPATRGRLRLVVEDDLYFYILDES